MQLALDGAPTPAAVVWAGAQGRQAADAAGAKEPSGHKPHPSRPAFGTEPAGQKRQLALDADAVPVVYAAAGQEMHDAAADAQVPDGHAEQPDRSTIEIIP